MDAVNRGHFTHFVTTGFIPSCASCEAPPEITELKEAPTLKVIPKKPFPVTEAHRGSSDLRERGGIIGKPNGPCSAGIYRVGAGLWWHLPLTRLHSLLPSVHCFPQPVTLRVK